MESGFKLTPKGRRPLNALQRTQYSLYAHLSHLQNILQRFSQCALVLAIFHTRYVRWISLALILILQRPYGPIFDGVASQRLSCSQWWSLQLPQARLSPTLQGTLSLTNFRRNYSLPFIIFLQFYPYCISREFEMQLGHIPSQKYDKTRLASLPVLSHFFPLGDAALR